MSDTFDLGTLVGKTIASIDALVPLNEFILVTQCGLRIRIYHDGECCNEVKMTSNSCATKDLVGSVIVSTKVVVSEPSTDEKQEEFSVNTIFNIATDKGVLKAVFRGHKLNYQGQSNSVSIQCQRVDKLSKGFQKWYSRYIFERLVIDMKDCSGYVFRLDSKGDYAKKEEKLAFEAWKASRQAIQPETIQDALLSEIGQSLDCSRCWTAWQVGTMTEDDFHPLSDRIDEVVQAVMYTILPD